MTIHIPDEVIFLALDIFSCCLIAYFALCTFGDPAKPWRAVQAGAALIGCIGLMGFYGSRL